MKPKTTADGAEGPDAAGPSATATRAFVVHPHLKSDRDSRRTPESALAECVALAAALDLEVVGAEVAPLAKAHAGALFGSGKIAAIKAQVEATEVELVIVDAAVTPIQQRNLEKAWGAKVLDRTGLILEIFGERASTREGVLQVDLAHLSYQKSRLVRSWTHLERQRGGVGFMGGPGETQIEADRRALDEKIARLRRQLEKVVQTRGQHRKARAKTPVPVVALVGYTNAGKSTLFNRLTTADVLAKDMLFATLDPTMRAIRLPSGRRVILSDTVGFISELPTQLVAAFRATLEEVLEADVIVHVRDVSHPETEAQKADVLDVLADLGVGEARLEAMVEARNKIDLVDPEERGPLLAETARAGAVALSAATGEGVDALMAAVEARLAEARLPALVRVPQADGRAAAWLHARGVVTGRRDGETFADLDLAISERELAQFAKAFPDAAILDRAEGLARAAQ
ncbi:MAG: GTPase HflX [Rhodobacteraceae bacterium]|nr:MAG: GTPase HflX [Paracoccaceae bacterium]